MEYYFFVYMNSLASMLSMYQKVVMLKARFASLIIHLFTRLAKNILNNCISLLFSECLRFVLTLFIGTQ